MRNSNFRGCHCNRFPLYRESRNSYRVNHETCQLINCTLLHRFYKILSGGERTISILASCRRRRLLPLSFTSLPFPFRTVGLNIFCRNKSVQVSRVFFHLWTDSIFTNFKLAKMASCKCLQFVPKKDLGQMDRICAHKVKSYSLPPILSSIMMIDRLHSRSETAHSVTEWQRRRTERAGRMSDVRAPSNVMSKYISSKVARLCNKTTEKITYEF